VTTSSPVHGERTMSGTRDWILRNARLRGEKSADEVDSRRHRCCGTMTPVWCHPARIPRFGLQARTCISSGSTSIRFMAVLPTQVTGPETASTSEAIGGSGATSGLVAGKSIAILPSFIRWQVNCPLWRVTNRMRPSFGAADHCHNACAEASVACPQSGISRVGVNHRSPNRPAANG
jgi:hypothetical protein